MTANFEPDAVKPPQEAEFTADSEENNEASAKPPQLEELLAVESDSLFSVKPPQ